MTDTAKKTVAKKAPAKKSAAKKSSAKKSSSAGSKVKLGDVLFVSVDPRFNNSSPEAPARVVNVLNVKGETRVNVKVDLDADADLLLRNVLVVGRGKAAEKAEADGQRVAFTSAS